MLHFHNPLFFFFWFWVNDLIFCFIYWNKGNLYGTLCTYGTRKQADEMRLYKGKNGFEVSAIAEIDPELARRLNEAKAR